jgi:DinB superfamily
MRIESTSFGQAELAGFVGELAEQDRRALIDRLERASARLGDLGARLPDEAPGESADWSPKEVLAHITVLSKFYGIVAYSVGAGQMTELDLLGQVSKRDPLGAQMAELPVPELVAMAQGDHRRTLDWLRQATPADLERRCDMGTGSSMSAGEVARLTLCAHLELHLDQLERSLA